MSIFTALIHRENDLYVAECPEVGSVSQGTTIEEALANLQEATELYIDETSNVPKSRAFITVFEVSANA